MVSYRSLHDMKHSALIHSPQHVDTSDILCVYEGDLHVHFSAL